MKLKNKNGDTVTLNTDTAEEMRLALRAINNPVRKNILAMLTTNGEMKVKDMWRELRIDQSACSSHLTTLRESKIVISNREGNEVSYSINTDTVKHLTDSCEGFAAMLKKFDND